MGRAIWIITGLIIIIALVAAFLTLRPDRVPAPSVPADANGSGNASVGASGSSSIVIYRENEFSPQSITVTPGTTVTWQNTGDTKLWVVLVGSEGDACPAASGLDECAYLSNGGTFSYTFTNPGTFQYINRDHPESIGTVTVSGDAPAAGPINADSLPQ